MKGRMVGKETRLPRVRNDELKSEKIPALFRYSEIKYYKNTLKAPKKLTNYSQIKI